MTATHCLRNHEIAVIGRSTSRTCRECLKALNRARNARRRLDPAYRARQAIYASNWYQGLTPDQFSIRSTKAWRRRLGAHMERKEDQIAAMREYALSIGIPAELIPLTPDKQKLP